MIDILILCLRALLYFKWKPLTYFYLAPIALVGVIADIIMNNTIVPLALGGGWFEEWTFSQRLERLCIKDDSDLITKDLCIQIALAINRVCPTHDHINAVLK